jgi:hypothetical protein
LSLLFYFQCSKNICSPLVCTSNDTKIVQFGLKMKMIFMCSMMGNSTLASLYLQLNLELTTNPTTQNDHQVLMASASICTFAMSMGILPSVENMCTWVKTMKSLIKNIFHLVVVLYAKMIIFVLLCNVLKSKLQCINASCHHALCHVIVMIPWHDPMTNLYGQKAITFLGLWLL